MFHELATILAEAMLMPSALLFQSHAALLGQALREAAREEASTVSYFKTIIDMIAAGKEKFLLTEEFNQERRNEPGSEWCTPVRQALGRERPALAIQESETSLNYMSSCLKKSKEEQQREAH